MGMPFTYSDGTHETAAGIVRADYARFHRDIANGRELASCLRAGPYAWPGGYAIAYLCDDGGTLCPTCVRDNYPLVLRAVREGLRDGWRVVGSFHSGELDEPENEFCAHCGVCIGDL